MFQNRLEKPCCRPEGRWEQTRLFWFTTVNFSAKAQLLVKFISWKPASKNICLVEMRCLMWVMKADMFLCMTFSILYAIGRHLESQVPELGQQKQIVSKWNMLGMCCRSRHVFHSHFFIQVLLRSSLLFYLQKNPHICGQMCVHSLCFSTKLCCV